MSYRANYRATAVLIAAGWMTGCTVGPNYHRPAVQVPQAFALRSRYRPRKRSLSRT